MPMSSIHPMTPSFVPSASILIRSLSLASSPSTTSRSLLSRCRRCRRCRRYLRNLRPETLVLVPLPCITLILICLLILLFDILLEVNSNNGGYESPIPNLEESDVTNETVLSSGTEDSPLPSYDHNRRMVSVCDLRDKLLLYQEIYDLTLQQRCRLRVSVINNVQRVLSTLAGDPYLLHQAHCDLIVGLRGLPSRDQTPSAL